MTEDPLPDFEAEGLSPEDRAHRLCQSIERGMARLGVVTTAHYEVGVPLIARMIRAVDREAANR